MELYDTEERDKSDPDCTCECDQFTVGFGLFKGFVDNKENIE